MEPLVNSSPIKTPPWLPLSATAAETISKGELCSSKRLKASESLNRFCYGAVCVHKTVETHNALKAQDHACGHHDPPVDTHQAHTMHEHPVLWSAMHTSCLHVSKHVLQVNHGEELTEDSF